MTTNGIIEGKSALGKTGARLIEIFQSMHSLTPEEVKEQRKLVAELRGLARLERALTPEETAAMKSAYTRLANLSTREFTPDPDVEEERLDLTATLLKIRERAGREAKKEEELLPWEREAREAEKEEGVSPVVSSAEGIAANKGVFNKKGLAWGKRRN